MGNFLEDLPVFEGQPDEAKQRAILQFGLGLMQPQNPITGGGPLAAFSDSVQAGLGSLDQDEAKRAAADQQVFQNLITSRSATDTENRTGILETSADGTVASQEAASKLGIDTLANDVTEHTVTKALSVAKINLDTAQAEWLRRRWTGPPSGSSGGNITAAMLEDKVIKSQMVNLIRADPAKYTLQNGELNLELAMMQAFNDLHKGKGVAGSDTIGLIAKGDKSIEISGNISNLQGHPPVPVGSTAVIPTLSTPEEVSKLKSGDKYIWADGKTYQVN